MLENLTKNFTKILNNIIGKRKLSEENIKEILTKLRKTLIEADVSWNVIKNIINNIKIELSNIEIVKKISPGNIFLKVLNKEFIKILSKNELKKNIFYKKNNLNKILLIGLHGSGKTTSIVKLAKFLKIKNKRNPIIIGCDIHRPAAMEQLEILSKKASIDYLIPELNENLDFFLKKAIIFSEKNKHDYLLIDSAGRLHTDEKMMHEILKIEEIINPDEIILVMDSIFGKDAIKYFDSFNKKIKISGFILTKMDSDSKGGIILTLGYSTTIPIKFIGNGEGLDDLEIFNPNGITSRILGMGDISSLIEEIQSEKNNTVSDELTLRDLQMQMKQIINKGSIKNIIEKLPGAHLMQTSSKDENNEKFIKMYSIINSMTEKEKLFPNIINGSRKRRIAKGSGTDIKEVNKLLKNFHKIKNMNKKKFFLQNFYKEKI